MTYGDGVGNVDISATIAFHNSHGKQSDADGYSTPGTLRRIRDRRMASFMRFRRSRPVKADGSTAVTSCSLSPRVLNEIDGDAVMFEREALENPSAMKEVQAYFHRGFWQAMDTLRDKQRLEELWASGEAPWKTW